MKKGVWMTVIDEVCRMETYLSNGSPDGTYFYHANHQGTVYTVTDETGKVKERYEYDEYGNVRSTTGEDGVMATGYVSAIGNSFLFQGRRYDPEINRPVFV